MDMQPIILDAPTLDEALRGVAPEPALSAHELAVARMLAGGATHAEIAAATGVSARGLQFTVIRLLEKTRTRSEAHLVTRLIKTGKIA
jgi:DNA-binding CsgD family transcriptional regulator